MTESRKLPVSLPDGRQAEAVEVAIDNSNERWSEFKLADGTILRAKISIVSIVRVQKEYDLQGMPVYQINATPTFAFVDVPASLKKP